jgi:hypothetical protein
MSKIAKRANGSLAKQNEKTGRLEGTITTVGKTAPITSEDPISPVDRGTFEDTYPEEAKYLQLEKVRWGAEFRSIYKGRPTIVPSDVYFVAKNNMNLLLTKEGNLYGVKYLPSGQELLLQISSAGRRDYFNEIKALSQGAWAIS